MGVSLVNRLLNLFKQCAIWFDQILTATNTKDFYIAAVFVTFSVGFLLSAFRNGSASGLDAGSDKAAQAYKARSSRPYRLGRDHKIH